MSWFKSHPREESTSTIGRSSSISNLNKSLGKNISILNMDYTHPIHFPIYEGNEDPYKHWFVCETIWEANVIDDENRQIS